MQPRVNRFHVVAEDDLILIEKIKKRDQKAMSCLFSRYSAVIYSIALRMMKDAESAEDITHDVLLQVWAKPPDMSSKNVPFGAWLVCVARHRAIDALRRRHPHISLDQVALPSSIDVDKQVVHTMQIERIQKVVASFAKPYQQVIQLAFTEGISHCQIAARLKTPLGTVKGRIRQSLTELRKHLAPLP